ncbi:type II 3-dehydroquinate dehydratase [Candidatus Neomarinimicrobiota bacterium]
MKFLILHGPNLNLLGSREPDVYGYETLDELNNWLRENPQLAGNELIFYQSNHEGDIIDCLHKYRGQVDGAAINPGAYTHYSFSIRDAISSIDYPVVEVHLSDIHNREEFRKFSVIADACVKQISGKGKQGYLEALLFLKDSA